MSKVIINDKETDIEIAKFNSFAEIMEVVNRDKIPSDMIIMDIVINNETVIDVLDKMLKECSAKDIETMKIYIADPHQIAYKTIKDISTFLSVFVEDTEKSALLFRTAGKEEANNEYEKYLENMQIFIDCIENIFNMFDIKYNEPVVEDSSISDIQKDLTAILKQMCSSQQSEDWIMLADIMEYELTPNLVKWEKFFSLFSEEYEILKREH